LAIPGGQHIFHRAYYFHSYHLANTACTIPSVAATAGTGQYHYLVYIILPVTSSIQLLRPFYTGKTLLVLKLAAAIFMSVIISALIFAGYLMAVQFLPATTHH